MCGAVTWAHTGPITRRVVCHCEDCQKTTSSPGTYRGFCPAFGTRLYFRSDQWHGENHLHAATLDELENTPQHQGFEGTSKREI